MIYFNLKDYQAFKDMFGKRLCNNGRSVRNNALLLTAWKDCFRRKDWSGLQSLNSMADIYPWVLARMSDYKSVVGKFCGEELCFIDGVKHAFYSPDYRTDNQRGLCLDGDIRSVRYVRKDNDRVFKMKAGKFMRHLVDVGFAQLCEPIKNYVCETFVQEWTGHSGSLQDGLELRVDEDFEAIYDSDNYDDKNFGSCMVNKFRMDFYRDRVNALAAGLWDADGVLKARCVIFTRVTNCATGEVLRLAERQYSAGSDDVLKRILVNRLIDGGHIDGYKKIGAGCSDTHSFLLNDGTPLRDDLKIDCTADASDCVPYMDTFKWYNSSEEECYNDEERYHDYVLNETNGDMEVVEPECEVYRWDGDRWYHDYVTERERDNYYRYCGRYDEYYSEDYVTWSDYHQDYIPDDECVFCAYLKRETWKEYCAYSALLEDWVLDEDFDKMERQWKEENWEWDSFNEKYAETVTEVNIWNDEREAYDKETVSTDDEYRFFCYDGELYDKVDRETGLPFGIEVPEAVCA